MSMQAFMQPAYFLVIELTIRHLYNSTNRICVLCLNFEHIYQRRHMKTGHLEDLSILSERLFNGIKFARMMKAPDSSVLWIDDEEHIRSLLDSDIDVANLCFMCAGSADDIFSKAAEKGAVIECFDTDLMTLYDCAVERLLKYQSWKEQLLNDETSRYPIQGIVDTAAKIIDGTIVLFDQTRQISCFGGIGNCDYLPLSNASAFGQMTWLDDMNFDRTTGCAPAYDGWSCKRQHLDGETAWDILVFFKSNKLLCDIDILISMLSQGIARINTINASSSRKNNSVASVFTKILDGAIKNECAINQVLSQTDCPPLQFCTIAIIKFSNQRITPSAQMSLSYQFSQTFPDSRLIVYNDRLVALISDSGRKNQPYPDFDQDKLNTVLENSGAYAAFSNATSRRSMLRTNYLLANKTLELACCLSEDIHKRVFFYEDYVEYITIDLCAKSFSEVMGHNDIIYLTHPGVVRIYRYDKLHDTDLLKVLYNYCIQNCNVSLAAEASYMHRNTFAARLSKLRTIFTEDLSSSEVQHRVVFSYKVLQYYEKFCKVKLTEQFKQSPPV